MENRKSSIIISEENDYIGYLCIMLFLTIITFSGINIWKNPIILEYQQIENEYNFIYQTYINYFEIGYILYLIGTIYCIGKLNYNYDSDFEKRVHRYLILVLYFTLFTQTMIIAICSFAPEIEIYEKSNCFIGEEILIPSFYQYILNSSYILTPVFFFFMCRFSLKTYQGSIK